MEIKYPEVHVKLVGEDGNALAIISRVQRALQLAGVQEVELKEFIDDAMSGDYDHLLAACTKWVVVE